jgi:hypothetical protein
MSFVAVVLQNTEYWPTSGGVTAYQINNALILPLAAQTIMGTGGVVAIVLMVKISNATSKSTLKLIVSAGFHGRHIVLQCGNRCPCLHRHL